MMSIRLEIPPAAVLHRVFQWDGKRLVWKHRDGSLFRDGANSAATNASIWNTRYAGKPAYIDQRGRVCIFGVRRDAVEVIRVMGYEPPPKVRSKPKRPEPKYLSAGIPGIYWNPKRRRWRAQIYIEERCMHLGSHRTLAAAIAARREAEQLLTARRKAA